MITLRVIAVSAIASLTLPSAGFAELPPDAYRSMQSEAPEALKLTVEQVTVRKSDSKQATLSTVSASARVDQVTRTATKLKPGDSIRISYQHRSYKMPRVGPSEPDIVEKARSYPAFLRKVSGGSYSVAAGGYSFRELK